MQDSSKPFIYWRKPRVRLETGLSDSTIDRLERSKKFPNRYHITPKLVAWRSIDVEGWKASREQASGGGK